MWEAFMGLRPADKIAAVAAVVAILTLMVGVGALVRGFIELKRQNAARRFETFQAMDKRFDGDFPKLGKLLDEKSLLDEILKEPRLDEQSRLDVESRRDEKLRSLRDYDVETKLNFIAFFEEVAVSVNSNVMEEEVAFYFFSHYAVTCSKTPTFWEGDGMIPKGHPLWSLYDDHTSKLDGMDKQLHSKELDLTKLRFT